MGRGQWTRWGGGMCEGWSLEIGVAFYGSVVRRDRSGDRPTWIASINSTGLGEFLERENYGKPYCCGSYPLRHWSAAWSQSRLPQFHRQPDVEPVLKRCGRPVTEPQNDRQVEVR